MVTPFHHHLAASHAFGCKICQHGPKMGHHRGQHEQVLLREGTFALFCGVMDTSRKNKNKHAVTTVVKTLLKNEHVMSFATSALGFVLE